MGSEAGWGRGLRLSPSPPGRSLGTWAATSAPRSLCFLICLQSGGVDGAQLLEVPWRVR